MESKSTNQSLTINPNLIGTSNYTGLMYPNNPTLNTDIVTDDNDNSRFLASLLGQGAGMLGSAIQGGDVTRVGQVFDYNRQYADRLNEQKKQIELITNPNSDVSKKKRMVYSQALGFSIPDNFSASDLEDKNVLQGLYSQSLQKTPVGIKKPKEEQKAVLKDKDLDTLTKMTNLNSSIDQLIDSVNRYGNESIGGEALNQKELQNSIAVINNVLKGQGAMTESDFKQAQEIFGKATLETPKDFSIRMNEFKKRQNDNIINDLQNKGFDVKEKDGKYYVFKRNNPNEVLYKF